jgi:nucleotide-binding universal stress UspA family protein
MTIRDLAVFVDGATTEDETLRLAASLASRFDAHLAGIHVTPIPVVSPAFNSGMVDRVVSLYLDQTEERQRACELLFSAATEREGVRAEWRPMRGDTREAIAVHARCADLAIVRQVSPEEAFSALPSVLPEDIALLSGRPTLVVPHAGRFETLGRRPLIAWKSTREAARAVHDALPLLRGAEVATIFAVDPDLEEGATASADIARHLARHDIEARIEQTVATDIAVADLILSRAADLDSDLLVMGAYGHSRLRELVLGGVTRAILKRMTLPVLMSH